MKKTKSYRYIKSKLLRNNPRVFTAACVFLFLIISMSSHAQNAPDAESYVGSSVTIANGKMELKSNGSTDYTFLEGTASRAFELEIRESFESLMQYMEVGAKVEGSYMGVSGSAEMNYKNRLDSSTESFYQVVLSSITEGTYTLTSNGRARVIQGRFQNVVLPTGGISQGNEEAWHRFFEKYGSHIIKSVDYGGQFNMIFRSRKEDMNDLSDFSAKARVAYESAAASASGELSYEQQKEYNTSVKSIRLVVDILGGDKSLIPGKVTNYEHLAPWIRSVQNAPAPLKYDCIPIWDLNIPNLDENAHRDIEAAYNALYNRPTRTGGVMSGDTVTLTMGDGSGKQFLCRSDHQYWIEEGFQKARTTSGFRCYTNPKGDFSPNYDQWIVKLSMNPGDSRREPIGYDSIVYLKAKTADLWLTGFRLAKPATRKPTASEFLAGRPFLQETEGAKRSWSSEEDMTLATGEGLFHRGFTEVYAADGLGDGRGANAYKYQWEIRQQNGNGPIYFGDHVKFYVNTPNSPADGSPDLRESIIGLSGGRGGNDLLTFLFDGRKQYPNMYSKLAIEAQQTVISGIPTISYKNVWKPVPDPSLNERKGSQYFFRIDKVEQ